MEKTKWLENNDKKLKNIDWTYSFDWYSINLKLFDFPDTKYYLLYDFKRLWKVWNKVKWYSFLEKIISLVGWLWNIEWVYIKAENKKLFDYYEEFIKELQNRWKISAYSTSWYTFTIKF